MDPAWRLVEIDLSAGMIQTRDLDQSLKARFLGGRGLSAWLAHQYIQPGTDPLGPDNVLLFSAGLLAGTAAPGSSRLHVTARSPQTGLLGSSNAGGFFAPGMRSLGLTAILIRGRASNPVYLLLDQDRIEIRDASALWGLDAWQTEEALIARLGHPKPRVITIGPAGENLVPMACLIIGRHSAAGRTGMGAVMGSKNLKAMVMKAKPPKPEMNDRIRREVVGYLELLKSSPEYGTLSRDGQGAYLDWANEMGMLATRNYRQVRFEGASRIGNQMLRPHLVSRRACHRCPIHCKADLEINQGERKGLAGPRPEFESIVALGSKCGLDQAEELFNLNCLCGRMGLDTISAGSCLAFAMDLFQEGIISSKETDGLDLSWGDPAVMSALLKKMAFKKGFGAILAQGVRAAVREIGRGAEAFAMEVKGLELSAYDPRAAKATGLAYAVSSRGGDFGHIFASPEYRWSPERALEVFGDPRAADRLVEGGKGAVVRLSALVSAALDCLGLCKVGSLILIGAFDLKAEAALTSALTDLDLSAEALFLAAERVVNLERILNLRLGAHPQDDTLPSFFRTQPVPDGPAVGRVVDLTPMLQQFYQVMGWDENGRPDEDTLWDLGLWKHVTWVGGSDSVSSGPAPGTLIPVFWSPDLYPKGPDPN